MWYPDGPQASVPRTPYCLVLWVFLEPSRHLESLRHRASKRAHTSVFYSRRWCVEEGTGRGFGSSLIRGVNCNRDLSLSKFRKN
jgi:hypothetical protein